MVRGVGLRAASKAAVAPALGATARARPARRLHAQSVVT